MMNPGMGIHYPSMQENKNHHIIFGTQNLTQKKSWVLSVASYFKKTKHTHFMVEYSQIYSWPMKPHKKTPLNNFCQVLLAFTKL